MQALGAKPSRYWGNQKVWFRPKGSKKTLMFLLESLNHSPHIMSHKLSRHKEAAGAWSSIAKGIVEGGETAVKYGKQGAKFIAEHGSQIMHGIDTTLNYGSQAVQMANKFGILDPDDDPGLLNLSNLYQQARGSGFAHDNQPTHRARKKRIGHLL